MANVQIAAVSYYKNPFYSYFIDWCRLDQLWDGQQQLLLQQVPPLLVYLLLRVPLVINNHFSFIFFLLLSLQGLLLPFLLCLAWKSFTKINCLQIIKAFHGLLTLLQTQIQPLERINSFLFFRFFYKPFI